MKQRLGLRAAGILVLAGSGIGCLPEDCAPPSLVVLDAFGEPPTEGFVFLTQSTGTSGGNLPLAWEVLGDTLHWDPVTGHVTATQAIPPNAWWSVHSPDPLDGSDWRNARVEVATQDTVCLTIEVPFQVTARLNRGLGAAVSHYSLESSSRKDPRAVLETWEVTTGTVKTEGQLKATSFPATLWLVRHTSLPTSTRLVAKTEVEFSGSTTAIHAHWSDVDFLKEQP